MNRNGYVTSAGRKALDTQNNYLTVDLSESDLDGH